MRLCSRYWLVDVWLAGWVDGWIDRRGESVTDSEIERLSHVER